ncbi:hypothetical protein HPG69_000367, partial [Diceros bicornis minor]
QKAPPKKGGEKKGPFCHQQSGNQRVPHQHSQVHPWKIQKFVRKELGTSDVHMNCRLNKAVWAKGIRNVPYYISIWLSRKHDEDEDSPN